MNEKESTLTRRTITPRWLVALLLAILTIGALLAWWMVARADREMREDLLHQAQLLSRAMDAERVKELSGTKADLASPRYERLKRQLSIVRLSHPEYRFVYLMGRKADGKLFFFVDSEPVGSENYSPPGQAYDEAPEGYHRVFSSHLAATEGPYTDRWGAWITALVPIHDPASAQTTLTTQDEARTMVGLAVEYYRKYGRERFLQEVSNPSGLFRAGDLYAFAYDRTMTMLAHPVKPELIGKNLLDQKDWAGGKLFRKEIQEVALSHGSGWVDYEYENPASKAIEPKATYVELADDLIICSGAYTGTGSILAVLGMDIDARAWNRKLALSALPPVLLMLTLVAIFLTGAVQLARRSRLAKAQPRWMRHLEPALAVAVGLVVTIFSAWIAHSTEHRNRSQAFTLLSGIRTEAIVEMLRDIRATSIESLALFYENSARVNAAEFQRFTAYLTKNPAVQSWEWIPAVPAADKARFEASARASGLKGFTIWQKDTQWNRIPATGRSMYYPVFRVAPLAGNERELGYDRGSEPLRRAALEEAIRTGLPTCSDPVTLVQNAGVQKGMLVFRPVFDDTGARRLRGFTLAVLRMEKVLRGAAFDNGVFTDLSLLGKDATAELLATSRNIDSTGFAGYSTTRTVFAFGKVFLLTSYAGEAYMNLHPARAGWLAILTGLLLTAAFGVITSVLITRRWELERLVEERTSALRESEQSYRNQFDHNSAVMLLIDPVEGAIIDANTAALGFYGYPQERLLTMKITDINTLPASEVKQNMAAVSREQGDRFEFQHRLADGSVRDVQVSSSRIQFGGRTLLHSIIHDITDQKHIMIELQKLAQAVRQSASTIVITDSQGAIEFVNPQFEKATGYSASEALNKNPRILKSGIHTTEFYRDMWATLKSGQEWIGEICNRKKNGELFWEHASIAPIVNEHGKTTHYVAVKDDISERKKMEKDIVRARDAAEAANLAKSDFLANMSHEIRTPMNGVIGMTGLLLDTELNDEQRHYAETVRSSGESLLTLINDILDFSKMEAGKLELESLDFDLRDLLDDFAAMLAMRAHQKGLEFICSAAPDLPTRLIGDPGRLRQVLTNLSGNAIKFTHQGEISVRVSLVTETDAEVVVRFSVKDTGIGIPAEKQQLLFQKFSQADSSTTRKYGGTGLGLAISKQLSEMMGGDIGIISEDGHGSEFWFTVRLGKQPEGAQQARLLPADLHGSHILVVDDNATNREVLTAQFKAWGIRVEEAPDGAAALAALYKARDAGDPFLAGMLDMQMPVMDGAELARAIKDEETLKNTHLILMTSLGGQRGDAKRMKDLGFAAYLSKPLRQTDLFDTLSAVLAGTEVARSSKPIITRHTIREMRRSPARILLAEDNITNQMVATGILKKLGFKVDVVANGAEAVSALENIPYDLVLMDCQMPEMDGYEATRRIRRPGSKVRNPRIPIIAMTANAMQGDREKCLESGMNDYISKPVAPQALAETMDKWLRQEAEIKPQHTSGAPADSAIKNPVEEAAPPVFDKAGLMALVMGDEEFALTVVQAFLADIPGEIEALKSDLKAGNIRPAERHAHSIKGAAANVGGEALCAVALEMEDAGKAGNLEFIAARMPELEKQFDLLRAEMKKHYQIEQQ